MALYAITYDLIKFKDYPKLWAELDRLGAHKALDSVYLANLTSNTAQEVVNHLSQFVDPDDKLMAIRFDGKPRFTRANYGTNNWIASNT